MNGPNVTRPVCKKLTHLFFMNCTLQDIQHYERVLAFIQHYERVLTFIQHYERVLTLLSEPSLALKKCSGLTTAFDTHLL